MKKNLRMLFVAQLLILSFSQFVLSQNLKVTDATSVDKSENIVVEREKLFGKQTFDILETENLFEPDVTTINFDDLTIPTAGGQNAIQISPYRYPGVIFYYPNEKTYLTRYRSYSPLNSLIVGSDLPHFTSIYNVESLFIEFPQPTKDVAFIVGRDSDYNLVYVDVYQANNQLVASIPVNFGASYWYAISLNQYSQTIRKIVLRKIPPTIGYSSGHHIYLDNFQFTPVTTQSPEGHLDGVNIQTGKAWGWSRDPDNLGAANFVDCYVNGVAGQGTPLPRVIANIPSSDVGSHRFEVPIPVNFRDGNNHQLRCYGLDVTGGDPPTLLLGSPKTFRFNVPIGNFDIVTTPEGEAKGWSKDPDRPDEPNTVHFYINGPAGSPGSEYIGETVANIYRSDVGYHSFRFYIPPRYRNGQTRTIYAHGIDLTGDSPKLLGGNPKTFSLSPAVMETTFIEAPGNPLTINPHVGGGLRMFSERTTPTGPINNKVFVKAKISVPTAGVPVYFFSYDLDEPSTDMAPVDTYGDSGGVDNRSYAKQGDLCLNAPGCEFDSTASAFKVLTDSNGEAMIPFYTTEGHPGDNYAVAATLNAAEPSQIIVDGLNLRVGANGRVLEPDVDRTKMLTVWRTMHIEIDSMSNVEGNGEIGIIENAVQVEMTPVEIPLAGKYDPQRFRNGKMLVGGHTLFVENNTENSVSVRTFSGSVLIANNSQFFMYDDDDFNNNHFLTGINGDNGEDVTLLANSLNLLQENDDRDCSDRVCNVFAEAYIRPDYSWAQTPCNNANLPFVLNVPDEPFLIGEQIQSGTCSSSYENDDFWVVYVQVGYQSPTNEDCDPDTLEACAGGTTIGTKTSTTNDVSRECQVPRGSQGSLAYMENMRDYDNQFPSSQRYDIKTVPHEIGHQLGLSGDNSDPRTYFGLMGYGNGLEFVPSHLNVIRYRRKSPGIPGSPCASRF